MLKDLVFGTIGGLGLFLFGMGMMSDGLKKMAGQRLKALLEALTKHRVVGVLIGAFTTCLIQSSSATTVMTVGFVNAGLLSLRQALSVIMGANVGTTFTAWLVSAFALFKISSYAMPMIGAGFLWSILGRTQKSKSVGETLLGLGILFVGLHFMKEAFAPLQDNPAVQEMLIRLGGNPLLAVLAGTVITMLLQSSSASIALVQMLALGGAFGDDWHQVLRIAIPYILGDNIGTTITAQLAALRASRSAKRVAMGHTLFNTIGVLYILPFAWGGGFAALVDSITPGRLSAETIMVAIAMSHTLFNVFNTLVFLPFLNGLEVAVLRIIPVTEQERMAKPITLETHLLETPSIALQQARSEIIRMIQTAQQALTHATDAILSDSSYKMRRVAELEDLLDNMQMDITSYLTALSRKQLDDEVAVELPVLLHTVNDLERIGDHAMNIVEIAHRKVEHRQVFSEAATGEARRLQNEVLSMFEQVHAALEKNDPEIAHAALAIETRINQMQIEFRRNHVRRMTESVCTPEIGIIFIDFVDNVEKVGDHLTNIAQATIGGLQWTGVEPAFDSDAAHNGTRIFDLPKDPDARPQSQGDVRV
ncbi:Na/Pi cotransporter family protein [Planctomycetota bacterium]